MSNTNHHPDLKTSRLLLRRPSSKDLETIFFMRSDPGVNRYIKREPPRSIADAEEWLNRITLGIEEQKNFNWAITIPGEDKMLGSICLWNFSPDRTIAEIGYDLHPAHQGKGVMREAVGAVLEFGFTALSLRVIEAFTSRRNEASITLLAKKGFVLDDTRSDPDNPDNCVYAISRT